MFELVAPKMSWPTVFIKAAIHFVRTDGEWKLHVPNSRRYFFFCRSLCCLNKIVMRPLKGKKRNQITISENCMWRFYIHYSFRHSVHYMLLALWCDCATPSLTCNDSWHEHFGANLIYTHICTHECLFIFISSLRFLQQIFSALLLSIFFSLALNCFLCECVFFLEYIYFDCAVSLHTTRYFNLFERQTKIKWRKITWKLHFINESVLRHNIYIDNTQNAN